jgi:hypothetical protein
MAALVWFRKKYPSVFLEQVFIQFRLRKPEARRPLRHPRLDSARHPPPQPEKACYCHSRADTFPVTRLDWFSRWISAKNRK